MLAWKNKQEKKKKTNNQRSDLKDLGLILLLKLGKINTSNKAENRILIFLWVTSCIIFPRARQACFFLLTQQHQAEIPPARIIFKSPKQSSFQSIPFHACEIQGELRKILRWKPSSQIVAFEEEPQCQWSSTGICPFLWFTMGMWSSFWATLPLEHTTQSLGSSGAMHLAELSTWLTLMSIICSEPGGIMCSTVVAGGSTASRRALLLLQH